MIDLIHNIQNAKIGNEIIWIILLLVSLFGTLIMHIFFGRAGLFSWISISVLLANIEATKLVNLFGMQVTLGNIAYSMIYLSTDALTEIYGKNEAKKAVWLGVCVIILNILITQLVVLMTPADSDIAHRSLSNIFSFFPRLALASLVAFMISQQLDIFIFHKIKGITKNRVLWLRNNVSTIISQTMDSVIFTMIAFYGVYHGKELLDITIFTLFIKILVALADTPFIYAIKYLTKKDIN